MDPMPYKFYSVPSGVSKAGEFHGSPIEFVNCLIEQTVWLEM